MPKQRITREMVVDAAFETARSEGMEQVMVAGAGSGASPAAFHRRGSS